MVEDCMVGDDIGFACGIAIADDDIDGDDENLDCDSEH